MKLTNIQAINNNKIFYNFSYSGRQCETFVCDNYCNGNGNCAIGITGPTCRCNAHYWGHRCDRKLCEGCQNGGSCRLENYEKVCDCPPGFTGDECENEDSSPQDHTEAANDPCSSYKCAHGAFCINVNGTPVCDCNDPYNGDQCEVCRRNLFIQKDIELLSFLCSIIFIGICWT